MTKEVLNIKLASIDPDRSGRKRVAEAMPTIGGSCRGFGMAAGGATGKGPLPAHLKHAIPTEV